MATEAKTKPTEVSVEAFLDAVEPATRRHDGKVLYELMRRITGQEARMWGPTIVGFGSYRYRYDSGREGVSLKMGFSPRKASLVLYLPRSDDRQALLSKLGKHSTGQSCLYINKLADVDATVLETLVAHAWAGKSLGECD
jgi:hypothetical protein